VARLHHELAGPDGAPVLVLAPSLGTTLELWDEQVGPLRERFKVLRFDHRGHGRSEVPPGGYTIDDLGMDLLELLDGLGLERVHFAGVSLGAMVGMWVASHAPSRIDRLALLCTSPWYEHTGMWIERIARVRDGGTASIAEEVVAKWFTPRFPVSAPQVFARYVGMLATSPDDGYAGCCAAVAGMDLRPFLGDIKAPTLVVAGAEDLAAPADPHARTIVAGIGGAGLEIVAGAAHLANVEQPAAVTRLLLDHFGESGRDQGMDQGMRVRREVLGDEHVDRAVASTTGFTADFQEFITRYAWGDIWSRPGLDRRTRSAITLAMLAALHHDEELAMHVRAALRNGLTPAEISEILLQVAVYAGVPAANRALKIAQGVLGEPS